MKISSAKAKGRRASEEARQLILEHFKELTSDDIFVTPSSVNGPDLVLSALAKILFPFVVECKNQEKINIWQALAQAESHAKNGDAKPILVFKRNRDKLRVCLDFETFLEMLVK